MSIQSDPEREIFRFRDPQLRTAVRDLRAAVRHDPAALKAFERAIERVKYLDKLIRLWDDRHSKQAAAALASGNAERASAAAWLLFDESTRRQVLAALTFDTATDAAAAAERVQAAMEAGRLVEEGAQ
jgi:hypothetical protein